MLKIKILSILAGIVVLFLAAVLYRADQTMYQDRLSRAESQGRSTLTGIQQSLRAETTKLSAMVTSSTESFRKQKDIYAFFIATQEPSKKIQFERSEIFKPELQEVVLQQYIDAQLSKHLDKNYILFPWVIKTKDENQESQKYLFFAFRENAKAYVFVLDPRFIQKLIEAFKSANVQISVVDNQGTVLAQSEEEYFSSKLNSDAFLDEALQASAFGYGFYQVSANKKIFGFYDRVPQTNLTLLYSIPEGDIYNDRKKLPLQFIVLGLGFLFLGGGLIFFMMNSKDDSDDRFLEERVRLQTEINKLLEKEKQKPKAVEVANLLPPTAPTEDFEAQKNVGKKIVSSLAHQLNPYLASLVGLSNLIKEGNSSEQKANADVLLKDARRAKAALDQVFHWLGETQEPKIEASLDVCMTKALKNINPILEKNKVQVHKEIPSSAMVFLSSTALARALQEILQNSVEALDRKEDKKINIKLVEDGPSFTLTIQDNGEGIEPKSLERIFEPFFTTKAHRKQQGMGLAAAMGILQDHGASIKVDSERGKGTTVKIIFPKNRAPSKVVTPVKNTAMQSSVLAALHNDAAPAGDGMQAQEVEDMDFAKVKLPVPKKKSEPELDFSDKTVVRKLEEVNIDELLEVPDAQVSSLENLDNLQIDLPKFRFQKRPSILDDHQVNIPQNFEERTKESESPEKGDLVGS